MMRRHTGLLVTFALSLLVALLAADAPLVGKEYRIGLPIPGSASGFASRLAAFRHELRDRGYVENRTIAIESRFAEGQPDRLPALAAELVRLPVDAIVVDGIFTIRMVGP